MVLGFSQSVVAAEGESRVSRPSLRCIRSWCCSMLLSVKSVSSVLPEVSRLYQRWEADVTVQHVTSHCTSLHISFEWCARVDQAEDIPNLQPQMAMAIRNSLSELRRAKGESCRRA
jgi:hypothetical protein